MSELAIFGGPKAVTYVGTGKNDGTDLFKWPIITDEDREAALDVINKGAMSGTDITRAFEEDFKKWAGVKYAHGLNNGTAALHAALYGCGVGRGDEVICQSLTYWASITGVYSLGATPVFVDVEESSFCLDPKKLEAKITDKTKAIVVVHYCSYPTDMDPIMEIARKHNIKVVEDVSHAQGGMYKGRMLGTLGDVAAASLMSGKSLAIGEAGMLWTNNLEIYERAVSLGSYELLEVMDIQTDYLKPVQGLPAGGYKYRMHQVSAAMGRVQLKHYDERCKVIDKAAKYFKDLISDVKGVKVLCVDESDGSTMAGWYATKCLYDASAFEGLSISRFCEALSAEGFPANPGANKPLHTHPVHQTYDIYNDGKPTRVAFSDRDLVAEDTDMEVTLNAGKKMFSMPWFKLYQPEYIEQYANAIKKVAANYKELLADDKGDPEILGGWHTFQHTKKK